MNAIVTLLIVVNMCCVCPGAKIPFARMCAAFCALGVCCCHFLVIIMTAVLRFRPYGQYCALSKRPTNFTGPELEDEVNDDWTYAKDGTLILALWVIQLLTFFCCCLVGGSFTGKP